jgi:Flp pilus assembly protein TadD
LTSSGTSRGVLLAALALVALVLAVFAQTLSFEFIDYDTPEYVAEHPVISQGLSWEGAQWVLKNEHVGNWHPVTGLAHMLDAQLFGVESARWHHAVNVLWHLVNTLLVFGLIVRLTGFKKPSFVGRAWFVAALFAVHPLHVESVVWVAERKDVLSTALALSATWVWIDYARSGRRGRYLVAGTLFALGLAAKPMLVTWPCVLLLLDAWPLERHRERSWRALVLEKLPLFGLSIAASLATWFVQRASGAMDGADRIGIGARVLGALVAYATYLWRAVWPMDLAVLYPHPELPGGTPLTAARIALAAFVLLGLTLIVLVSRRTWARVLWAGFLGTLVPVIGLVQVGEQATADRYTYLPLCAVFALVAWAGAELVERRGLVANRNMGALAIALVLAAAWQAHRQTSLWRDTETLFEHSLSVAPEPPTLHYNLARWLRRQGRADEALVHYERALELKPDYPRALVNLGVALQSVGRLDEAATNYRKALELGPNAGAHHNLAMLLRSTDLDLALVHHAKCLELRPDSPDALNALAAGWMLKGALGEAEPLLRRALALDPEHARASENLRRLLEARSGDGS